MLSKLKNTPKALISGQKSTLILKKTLTFSSKEHPFYCIKHWKNGNTNLTFDVIILCLFSGSRLRSPVSSGVNRVNLVDCKGISNPHTSYLGTKEYPSFTKSHTCGGLKKDPFIHEIRNLSAPPPPPRLLVDHFVCITHRPRISIVIFHSLFECRYVSLHI